MKRILMVLAVILLFSSCQKEDEYVSPIIGKWQMASFNQVPFDYYCTWTFTQDNVFTLDVRTSNDTIHSIGKYAFNEKTIAFNEYNYKNSTAVVVNLTKDSLSVNFYNSGIYILKRVE